MENLESTILIVDEAHNFFNSIVNGSQNAVDLYDMIMATQKIKILFLTGTPMINSIFEMVPCFNMLSGKILFDETSKVFNKYFINQKGFFINSAKFKNRIFGLVSYYGKWVKNDKDDSKGFLPKELPMKIIKVPMSNQQYASYLTYREKEIEEEKSSNMFVPTGRFAKPASGSSSYKIKSRMASNIVPIKNPTDDHILTNASKFPVMYDIITKKHAKQKGIISCDFVHNAGLADIGRYLELKGWTEISPRDMVMASKSNLPYCSYATISGDINVEERTKLQTLFNREDNIDGNHLRVLLLGPAAAEGLDLFEGRFNIQMGAFFHFVRSDQVKHRIIRYKGHMRLPLKERTVQVYLLLSVYPKDLKKKLPEHPTDVQLYLTSQKKKNNAMLVRKTLIESAMDCSVHTQKLPASRRKQIKCVMCNPTGAKLYYDDIHVDMKKESNCRLSKVTKIKATRIVMDGVDEKFMYIVKEDGTYVFFIHNPDINGYSIVGRDSPYFSSLYNAVEKIKKSSKKMSSKLLKIS